jgi:hypothetical protein
VDHLQSIFVNGGDGHQYRAELGFLSSPSSLAEIQRLWSAAGRGGANWSGVIQMRDQVTTWAACTADKHACSDNFNAENGEFTMQAYIRDYVWLSLLGSHQQGGWQATTQNEYYAAVQDAIFKALTGGTPTAPCLGFTFTRTN